MKRINQALADGILLTIIIGLFLTGVMYAVSHW